MTEKLSGVDAEFLQSNAIVDNIVDNRKFIKILIPTTLLLVFISAVIVFAVKRPNYFGKSRSGFQSKNQPSLTSESGGSRNIESQFSFPTMQPASTQAVQTPTLAKQKSTEVSTKLANIMITQAHISVRATEGNIPFYPTNAIDTEEKTYDEFAQNNMLSILVTITNDGEIDSGRVDYRLEVNGETKQNKSIDQLKPKEAKLINVDLPQDPGSYTISLKFNSSRSFAEKDYSDNNYNTKYVVKPDVIPPDFSFPEPWYNYDTGQTCMWPIRISDNITPFNELRFYSKFDAGVWEQFASPPVGNFQDCLSGTGGETHRYTVKIIDKRGNINEKDTVFAIQKPGQ